MSDIQGRYPLSTADGQAVPLDIIRPMGIVSISFNPSTGTSPFTLSDTLDCYSIRATEDCLVEFNATFPLATNLVNATFRADALYVPKNTILFISPPVSKNIISVLGISTSGLLHIQYIESWTGLALKNQYTRR